MIDFLLQQKFDAMFTEWNAKKGHRPGLHASSVLAPEEGSTGFCYREHVLGANFLPSASNISPFVLRIFLNGWSVHQKWQQLFVESGVAENVETTRASGIWKLLHTPDAVVNINHVRYVVEIKSMSHFAFAKLNTVPMFAVRQCQLYMHLTGIPQGIVLVEDKNSQEFKLWVIRYDLQIVLPYLERLHYIQEYIEEYERSHRLPVRYVACESATSSRAKGCPFREACFASRADRTAFALSTVSAQH